MPFIGNQSTANSKVVKYTYTATANQTDFNAIVGSGDDVSVYLNGILLKETTDYSYTSSIVTLGAGASAGDIVEVHVFVSMILADAVRASGDTMTGELEVPTVKLSSNIIKASDGGSTLTLDTSDNLTVAGKVKVGANIIQASDGGDTITLDTNDNVAITGDLTVTGGDIKSSGGTTAISISGANTTLAGDLTVTGNDIKASDGTTSITLSGANVAVAGNLTGGNIEGTTIKSTGESGGTKFLREDGDNSCSWQAVPSVPAGIIAPFGASSAPAGWLACDGTAVSRSTYSGLYAVIADTWGAGDGNTTFNLPDLRGAFLRGTGTAGVSGDYVGPTNVGDYQDDQNASHNHTATSSSSGNTASGGNHRHYDQTNWGGGFFADGAAAGNNAVANYTDYAGTHSHSLSVTTTTTIANDGGTEARVYNRGVLYCIKT